MRSNTRKMGILFPPFPTKKQSKVRFTMNIKKTGFFAAAAFLATSAFAIDHYLWLTEGSNTLPVWNYNGTDVTVTSQDLVIFGGDGVSVDANVNGEITSTTTAFQFSGSNGRTAGNVTINIGEGFTLTAQSFAFGGEGMIAGSTVLVQGAGTFNMNGAWNLAGAGITGISTVIKSNAALNGAVNLGEGNSLKFESLKGTYSGTVTIGTGSKYEANITSTGYTTLPGKLVVNAGTFRFTKSSGVVMLNDAVINSLSENAYVSAGGLNNSGTFKIGAGVDKKIIVNGGNFTMWDGNLELNSSNVLVRGDGTSPVDFELSGGNTGGKFTLGADNAFGYIRSNNDKSGYAMELVLNGHEFKVEKFDSANITLTIDDFADGLFVAKTENISMIDLDKIIAKQGETTVENLFWKDLGNGYSSLVSTIPEPATVAAIFGAAALALAVVRRRK